jgi:hypothetical protein
VLWVTGVELLIVIADGIFRTTLEVINWMGNMSLRELVLINDTKCLGSAGLKLQFVRKDEFF